MTMYWVFASKKTGVLEKVQKEGCLLSELAKSPPCKAREQEVLLG